IVVTLIEKAIVGVDAENGNVLWKYDCDKYMGDARLRGNHPNTPIYKDGYIYVTSGYDMGGVKLKISGDGMKVSQQWSDKNLDTHHGGVLLVDGFLYGSNWDGNPTGNWVCLDWETGKKQYEQKWKGKGSIAYADGMLYCYEEKTGNVALVKAIPKGFNITSSFKVPLGEDQHWAHPVIFDGKLFIRHGDALMVYDIKQG
ncbi:MAG: PQQ-like beta-propeller repeat protein, partial [Planctomycetes bacterium]|nr:PQQ-like beta-propeller repeat protein [Planctomycetota bacterium]